MTTISDLRAQLKQAHEETEAASMSLIEALAVEKKALDMLPQQPRDRELDRVYDAQRQARSSTIDLSTLRADELDAARALIEKQSADMTLLKDAAVAIRTMYDDGHAPADVWEKLRIAIGAVS